MGQIVKQKRKKKMHSIKQKFLVYIPICVIAAYAGAYAIGFGTNHLQDLYIGIFTNQQSPAEMKYEIRVDEYGNLTTVLVGDEGYLFETWWGEFGFWLVSYAQAMLIPVWIFLCVIVTGRIFYRREMAQPITVLLNASEKISENCLDFQIESVKHNELGRLCQSFEKMREALYQNNRQMWRMLEERTRLNAAFAHDMRTPITVLKGYADLLEKYVPDGRISEEKLVEILGMMSNQINRLESYTRKMAVLQKIEDVVPCPKRVEWQSFLDKCRGINEILSDTLQICCSAEKSEIWIDEELVLEVYENLASNAVRYASCRVEICFRAVDDMLEISVEDDGIGFTPETLRRAAEPFYREKGQDDRGHFGIGLYISKILCEKCGGELLLENGSVGAKVTARFGIK